MMKRPIAVAVAILSVIGGAVLWLSRTEPPTDIAYYRVSDQGVTPPKVISETKPSYPSEAQQAKIQGSVFMRCVVQTSGICEDIQVARSLDPMWLDREAVSALQQWRFTPGSRMGQPVPVLVDVEFSFTVR